MIVSLRVCAYRNRANGQRPGGADHGRNRLTTGSQAEKAYRRLFLRGDVASHPRECLSGLCAQLPPGRNRPCHLPSAIIHVHAVIFSSWILLFITQIALVSIGKIAWHKRLGIFGPVLACLMVIFGVLAATDQPEDTSHLPASIPPQFLPLRRRNCRYCVSGHLGDTRAPRWTGPQAPHDADHDLSPAVNRCPFAFIHQFPPSTGFVINAFLLSVIAFDLLTCRKIHRAQCGDHSQSFSWRRRCSQWATLHSGCISHSGYSNNESTKFKKPSVIRREELAPHQGLEIPKASSWPSVLRQKCTPLGPVCQLTITCQRAHLS